MRKFLNLFFTMLQKCRSEGILLELLYVMLKMAGKKECAEGLISGLIVQKVFIFVMRNTERTTKDLPDSTKWSKVSSQSKICQFCLI